MINNKICNNHEIVWPIWHNINSKEKTDHGFCLRVHHFSGNITMWIEKDRRLRRWKQLSSWRSPGTQWLGILVTRLVGETGNGIHRSSLESLMTFSEFSTWGSKTGESDEDHEVSPQQKEKVSVLLMKIFFLKSAGLKVLFCFSSIDLYFRSQQRTCDRQKVSFDDLHPDVISFHIR